MHTDAQTHTHTHASCLQATWFRATKLKTARMMMIMMIHWRLLALVALISAPSWALQNGVGRRPPMGWLAWERFTCETDCRLHPDTCISSRLFVQMAERLVDDGYRQLGYRYLNIDDCWSEAERDNATGELVPNRQRFPERISGLANLVHSKGLYLGLYGDCGYQTCAGYPAQLSPIRGPNGKPVDVDLERSHFERDARSLQDWQVDSFKFDGCYIEPRDAERVCPLMASALSRNSRPVLLTCEWPFYLMYAHAAPNFTLAAESCNAWRFYDDIEGPGHWFDPDQLVIGNFGLSLEQERAQMGLWSIWSAPLFMSNDLRSIATSSASILKNRHLIEVNQDPMGVWGQLVASHQQVQVFVKPVMPVSRRTGCPSFAVLYLNRATLGNAKQVSFELRDLLAGAPLRQAARNQLEAGPAHQAPPLEPARCLEWLGRQQVRFQVRDLFGDQGAPAELELAGRLSLRVSPSGVRALKLLELAVAQAGAQ